ncbi:MAG: universal stress protein [Natronomonas sp.]
MATHVLVPIDGSQPSWAALEYAIENFAGTRITVIHVVDPTEGLYAGIEGGYYDPDAFDRATEQGEDLCEEAKTRLENAGILEETEFEGVVESGRPARTILDYIHAEGVDHVVMGSHGRSGVTRVLLGSVAEMVTRRSPVPVTVIR